MIKKDSKNKLRLKRHLRNIKNLRGNSDKPRLCVFKSLKHIYAQIINDDEGNTIFSVSTLSKDFEKNLSVNKETAEKIGKKVGEECKKRDISKIVFDRNGYKYHGRIKALADAVRSEGISF